MAPQATRISPTANTGGARFVPCGSSGTSSITRSTTEGGAPGRNRICDTSRRVCPATDRLGPRFCRRVAQELETAEDDLAGDRNGEYLGSFEEDRELWARPEARGPLRRLQVHVPSAGPGRMQAGPGVDPGLRHLRSVHATPSYLRPLSPQRGPQPKLRARGLEREIERLALAQCLGNLDRPELVLGNDGGRPWSVIPVSPLGCRWVRLKRTSRNPGKCALVRGTTAETVSIGGLRSLCVDRSEREGPQWRDDRPAATSQADSTALSDYPSPLWRSS